MPPLPTKAPPRAAIADPPIMPVSQVRAGMKGYGLTVFHGTRIERFEFEVLGVLPSDMGQPLILVRLTGGPIPTRGAFLIHGHERQPVLHRWPADWRLLDGRAAGQRADRLR